MNKLAVKLIIIFCILSILVFGGCTFFALNLYHQAQEELERVNAQYADEEVIRTYEIWTNNTPLAYTDGMSVNDYQGYNAIYKFNSTYFVSYSEYWDQSKLHDLAIEMYNNVHGEEINYVARVELVDGETEAYAGYQTSEYENFSVPIALYGAMPLSMTMDVVSRFSVIRLTGADTNTTVETMARTLSHEYGHHYTQYYFGFTGTNNDLHTDYYEIRNESGYDIYAVAPSEEYYMTNHMWHIQEIAAEDYVYFMGSPNAHNAIDYKDTEELVEVFSSNNAQYEKLEQLNTLNAYNSIPHENPVLRSPNEVTGLAQYYYSFVGESPPDYTQVVTKDLNIHVEPDGEYGYKITWSQYYTDPSTTYTLLAYDANDNIIWIVRTTNGDEPGTAKIGKQIIVNSMAEYSLDDGIPSNGYVRFRVVTVLPDSTAYYSLPYDVNFT